MRSSTDTRPLPNGTLANAVLVWPERYYWPPTHLWFDSLLAGFRRHRAIRRAPLQQPQNPVVLAELRRGGDRWPLAFDHSDYADVDEELAHSSTAYFKYQHRPEGYGHEQVFPGGYVPMGAALHRHLWWLRRLSSAVPSRREAYDRFLAPHQLAAYYLTCILNAR
jgi:hypothetical protein